MGMKASNKIATFFKYFVLILVGVIGGLLALGIIGLFIGPVVLAVGYTLLDAWIKEGEQTPALEAPASPPAE